MSNLAFPSLPGLIANVQRDLVEDAAVQTAISGKEWRSTWSTAPKYRYRVGFEFLRSTVAEFQQLVGFYVRHRGSLDSFLFQDVEDCIVAAHPFGVGNAVATAFQLQRTLVPDPFLAAAASRTYWPAMGDGYEPVVELAGAPVIYVGGVAKTGGGIDYTLGTNGTITFTAAPANGAVLTWDGPYWRRVRFAANTLSKERIVQSMWAAKSIDLLSVVGGAGNTFTAPPAGVVFSATTPPSWSLDSGLLY